VECKANILSSGNALNLKIAVLVMQMGVQLADVRLLYNYSMDLEQ